MEFLQKMTEKMAREKANVAKIKKWAGRIKKLKNRADPMNEATFCAKYDIHAGRFNRLKNLKEHNPPSDNLINKIEAAFEAEGV